MPSMLREMYSTQRGIWPQSVWKYVVILRLRDRLPRSVERIDVSRYPAALPFFVALRRLSLRVEHRDTLDALLHAAGSVPNLNDLAIEHARLDGPPLSALSRLTRLRRLAISIDKPPREMCEEKLQEELQNVHECLRILSAHLHELETSADICPLETLADHAWPQLRTLIMTGHSPAYGHMSVSASVARMPCLRVLHLNFSAYCESPFWAQPPIFLYSTPSPRPPTPLPAALPHLESLVLSNVYQPSDTILDQLPAQLTCLRVFACKDFMLSNRGGYSSLAWPQRFPLSEPQAFRVVQHTSRMAALTELALALSFLPTPELVRAVAAACPQLTVLELAYSGYDTRKFTTDTMSFPSLDTLHDALCLLRALHVLRISVADTSAPGRPQFMNLRNWVVFIPFLEALAREEPTLGSVALSFDGQGPGMPRQPTRWLTFVVGVDRTGEVYVMDRIDRSPHL
ncbi:hypothetical protein PLICRDRAFT_429853 [Plicaturopsis crispa FD-325 SS-3]|uniref:F-box domain-containing protein n=1 Tax=Plicaturopsis crispa FD-325 SS-3 TaxID=944288 RepID=A0A0C9T6W8_PLICR|nr:hypothetical protein PLICRDRAFT_429853 [Plicaturopsis crispa FD-325 SS-3]